jgi:ankyrin repeat protein
VTALHYAVSNKHRDMVKLLLDSKADVNIKDDRGLTPLNWAENGNRQDLVNLMRQHGGQE